MGSGGSFCLDLFFRFPVPLSLLKVKITSLIFNGEDSVLAGHFQGKHSKLLTYKDLVVLTSPLEECLAPQ